MRIITTINFDRDISSESITSLIDQITQSDYNNHLVIYLKSSGGDPDVVQVAIDLINRLSKERSIEIKGYGGICSAAFDLIWQTECHKSLIPNTWALVHKTKLNTDGFDENSKIILEQKRVANVQDDLLYQFLKDSKVIPINDLKYFLQGRDVVIGYEKLKKLLNIL